MQKTEVSPQADLPLTRQPDPEWLDELPAQDPPAEQTPDEDQAAA